MKNANKSMLQTVASWADRFEKLVEDMGVLFSRSEARLTFRLYLQGLLASVERKNSWQLSETMGLQKPYAFQHLLGRAVWKADELRDKTIDYVVGELGRSDATLVIDETGFVKKGNKSAGVKRQYSGTAGRIENCQIGVFLTYNTPNGHALADRELYVPQEWIADRERCKNAGIPKERIFQTKPQLAQEMLTRTLEKTGKVKWVLGDSVYSASKLRQFLESKNQPYILGVTGSQLLFFNDGRYPLSDIWLEIPEKKWQRISCGYGTKGPRFYDWYLMRWNATNDDFYKGILFRRNPKTKDNPSFYSLFAPIGTSLEDLALGQGFRWTVEESFEESKGEAGLDEYEVRSYTGWYRHITLSMLAYSFLVIQRSLEQKKAP